MLLAVALVVVTIGGLILLASRRFMPWCSGGYDVRGGDTLYLTAAAHCAPEGFEVVRANGTAIGAFGPAVTTEPCPHPAKVCRSGPVQTKAYLATQRSFMPGWKTAVAVAVAKGWSREETIARVSFAERYPVDIGQEYMMGYVQERNAGAMYDLFTKPTETTWPGEKPPAR